MQDYKPNSYKYKEEQKENTEKKKVVKVVKGTAKPKKKSEIQKITDVFISEDISNVKNYILLDVLVPAVKDTISSIVKNGIDMLIYGEARSGSKKSTNASRVSYRSYYDDGKRSEPVRSRSLHGFDYDNIVFDNRGDAEMVLEAMDDIIEQYGIVSVGELYELADVTTTNYMVNRYGWTDIRSAMPVRTRDGWMIKLPKPVPIN